MSFRLLQYYIGNQLVCLLHRRAAALQHRLCVRGHVAVGVSKFKQLLALLVASPRRYNAVPPVISLFPCLCSAAAEPRLVSKIHRRHNTAIL